MQHCIFLSLHIIRRLAEKNNILYWTRSKNNTETDIRWSKSIKYKIDIYVIWNLRKMEGKTILWLFVRAVISSSKWFGFATTLHKATQKPNLHVSSFSRYDFCTRPRAYLYTWNESHDKRNTTIVDVHTDTKKNICVCRPKTQDRAKLGDSIDRICQLVIDDNTCSFKKKKKRSAIRFDASFRLESMHFELY